MTFLIFGGVWFWALVILASILLLLALEADSGVFATVVLLLATTLTLVLGNWSWVEWLIANPLYAVGGVAAYVLIGIIWSMVKWWFHVRKIAKNQREARTYWLQERADSPPGNVKLYENALATGVLDPVLQKAWEDNIRRHCYDSIKKPYASENKKKIMGWLAYWPWSFLWTFINDPVRTFFNWLYESLSGLYQRIADSAFRGLE